MALNCTYFRTTPGIIKCVSIILIGITLALSATAYFTSKYTSDREQFRELIGNQNVNLWREIYQICAASVCLIGGITNLILHLYSRELYWHKRTGIYDFLYHALTFLLLGTSGVLNIVSAVKVFEINCTSDNGCQEFELKFAAGGLSMISGLICGVIAAIVLTNRKDVERDGLLSDT